MALVKFIAVVVLGWLAYWWWSANDRENNRHINPAIYPAFRTIENLCLAEQFPRETVRCKKALALLKECTGSERTCMASDYYNKLWDMGFDLPPFYEPGYQPK